MEVRHIPDCYEPNIKTVAILPFKNESERARAGLIVARNLAKELRANGTYMVIDPNEVSKILEQSGQKIGDIDYKSQAQKNDLRQNIYCRPRSETGQHRRYFRLDAFFLP
jgi:hypothetical protein